MARNLTTVAQVVNDFMLGIEDDDYANGISETMVHNYALRGVRDLGFDMLGRIKSIKLSVNTTPIGTVDLPDDFVKLIKIGVVGGDGLVHVFGENRHINKSEIYKTTVGGDFIDSDGDGVYDREDSKSGSVSAGVFGSDDFAVFNNYVYQNSVGQLFGAGGGFYEGEYRLNLDQNRIELSTNNSASQVVIEYLADEARAVCPTVHILAEEALRKYIYHAIIERKNSVPASEKARARAEYYNERRLARARLSNTTPEEILKTIRKNFKQSPKY